MTARSVVLVQRIRCRASGTQRRPRPHLCRDRHKTQGWLCVFVLSILNKTSCALDVRDSEKVQKCLRHLTPFIKNSDAMLYAPSMNDIQTKCLLFSLECYVKELLMVIKEEEVKADNIYANCIFAFGRQLKSESFQVSCLPCEAHSLGDISTFLRELEKLLQAIAS
ncbi:uncharacterized protein il2 [Nerophis lumbriciformis]|uniref:uncharacterized protein il2 n=1 Tax=Nerophis lumbriciformis TaxID=546530 RepID=UPI003BA9437A